ncbi:MAG: hypothetical protein GX881_00310, partial [Firmicutes bacterium]|nr:hypothetical protein [Bacillota bacterium]
LLNCIHRSGGDLEPAKLAEYRIDLSPMLPEGERESLSVTAGPGTPKEKKLYRKSSLQLRPAGEENCGPGRITYIDPQECEALVKCWKRYPGRDWVNGYLELVRELLERAGLDSDDERLAMTIRSSKKLPVTINRRYVIRAAPSGRIGLIMPLDAVLPAGKVKEKVLYEDYFYKSGTRDAWWAVFDQENDVRLSPKVKQLWTEAALREVEAGKRSPYRKHHRPIFYWAVHDLKIREILLNDAFPEISPERFL